MLGLFPTTANASLRPPFPAGTISRNSRFFNLPAGFGWSAAAAAARPPVPARRKVRSDPSPHERRNCIVLLCTQGRESYRSRGRAASFVSGRAVGSLRSKQTRAADAALRRSCRATIGSPYTSSKLHARLAHCFYGLHVSREPVC